MINDFCTNLINYRQRAQLTRKDVANKLGITEIAYGAYERGKRLPDIEKLCTLSNLFETTPNELLNFKPDEFVVAKNIWKQYGFSVTTNKDESITLIFCYSVAPEEKIVQKNGKIDFHDFVIKKKADFISKQAFILYTKDIIKRDSQDSDFPYDPRETEMFFKKEFEKVALE